MTLHKALKRVKRTEAQKCYDDLVEYFNSPEGYAAFGAQGDHNMWPPQKTAVEAMRECIRLRDFYAAVGQAVVESMKRGTE